MVGVAHMADPIGAGQALENLRNQLLADAYFKGVPSMQPEARKTAIYFHAKDDLPEIRREVFKLLPNLEVKVQVAIRRKTALVSFAKLLHAAGKRLTEDLIYDDLIKRLFRNLLHKAAENRIVFARRGKRTRRIALERAIEKAKTNFEKKWKMLSRKPTSIVPEYSFSSAGLQIIDYYLWALQRVFELRQDRFFQLLRPGYRLIMDLDDKRNKPYGEWYTDYNPLQLRKIKAF